MKPTPPTLLLSAVLALSTFIVLQGCRTAPPTPEQQAQAATNLANVCRVTKAVVQTGLTADLLVNQQHRPLVITSLQTLDTAIQMGSLTGAQLAGIVSGLPINADTIRIVQGTLLVYDAASALWYTSDTQKILLALGTAVSEGAHAALVYSAPGIKSAAAPAIAKAVRPPEPVFTGPGANVVKLR